MNDQTKAAEETQNHETSKGKRYTVLVNLEIMEHEELIDHEDGSVDLLTKSIGSMPVRWNDLTMTGVISIEAQFLQAFLLPLLHLGAVVEMGRETDPGRLDLLKSIVDNLPKPAVLDMQPKDAVSRQTISGHPVTSVAADGTETKP
jgi:hypothetical protein